MLPLGLAAETCFYLISPLYSIIYEHIGRELTMHRLILLTRNWFTFLYSICWPSIWPFLVLHGDYWLWYFRVEVILFQINSYFRYAFTVFVFCLLKRSLIEKSKEPLIKIAKLAILSRWNEMGGLTRLMPIICKNKCHCLPWTKITSHSFSSHKNKPLKEADWVIIKQWNIVEVPNYSTIDLLV